MKTTKTHISGGPSEGLRKTRLRLGESPLSDSADDSKWSLDEHTRRKHRVLSYYLQIWSQILGNPFANLVYWDFFAGRGDYSGGEPGSPLIAMDISEKRFQEGNSRGRPINMTCIFVEKDKQCFYYLQDLLRDLYPDLERKRWWLYHGDCRTIYDRLKQSDEIRVCNMRVPQFFFLDPYGPNIPLEMIRGLMSPQYREAMITIMTEFVTRWVSEPPQETNLKSMFGVDDLITLKVLCQGENPALSVAEYYISRLKDQDGANVRHVTPPFEMTPDRRQNPLYYLIGCTQAPIGLRKMSETMRAISGNEDFSYRGKFEHQTSLEDFGRDRIEEIAEWILDRYEPQVSTFDGIFTFCCGEKTWSRTEVRLAILRMEREGKLVVRPRPGRTRRGNSLSNHFIEFQ